ncbi:MAG: hypothetical protein GOMPHAMPRED_002370 [Gomphillus americanus]|uniref:Peroxisomal membrane protein PEX14 n=1 Tax=Gomphillus americanus TaxID=1940652 RepID=A0A8H3FC68_9LECA|nr:MAG: hypothetical protein GOMPHAMPRED_002370 [Gomphillus americanus]
MAPREDLINSAVTFLQDPSVASAPLEQRRSFLQSKNLTAEEIQLALARAGENAAAQQYAQAPQSSYYAQQQGPPNTYGYNYRPYPPSGAWPQHTEPPRRDWRDWFIMATVITGLGWGLYTVAKRYVAPLIVPPTPPQLESDKASIDASFTRAFNLIEQLSTDTAALKEAEIQRQEKLDSALEEMNSVVEELKAANGRREEESRRLGDEVRGLREMIPKALDGWKAQGDERVKELGTELRSLKLLMGNRVGSTSSTTPASSTNRSANTNATKAEPSLPSSSNPPLQPSASTPISSSPTISTSSINPAPAPGITAPRSQTGSTTTAPFSFEGRTGNRSIPAWQMAATAASKNSTTGSTSDSASALQAESEAQSS